MGLVDFSIGATSFRDGSYALRYDCSRLQVGDDVFVFIAAPTRGGGNTWFSTDTGNNTELHLSGAFGTGLFGYFTAGLISTPVGIEIYRQHIIASDLSPLNGTGSLAYIGWENTGPDNSAAMAVAVFRGEGAWDGAGTITDSAYDSGLVSLPYPMTLHTATSGAHQYVLGWVAAQGSTDAVGHPITTAVDLAFPRSLDASIAYAIGSPPSGYIGARALVAGHGFDASTAVLTVDEDTHPPSQTLVLGSTLAVISFLPAGQMGKLTSRRWLKGDNWRGVGGQEWTP